MRTPSRARLRPKLLSRQRHKSRAQFGSRRGDRCQPRWIGDSAEVPQPRPALLHRGRRFDPSSRQPTTISSDEEISYQVERKPIPLLEIQGDNLRSTDHRHQSSFYSRLCVTDPSRPPNHPIPHRTDPLAHTTGNAVLQYFWMIVTTDPKS